MSSTTTPTDVTAETAPTTSTGVGDGRPDHNNNSCRHQPQRIGYRKKRQRKRPQSEWLLNETNTSASNNDSDHDQTNTCTTIVARLDIMLHNNNADNSGDCSSSTISQRRITIPDVAPHLRIVYPYPHTFTSFCKARWIGKSIYDVYCNEFGSYPATYYKYAIQQGRIRVSDQKVSCDYVLQATDILLHTVHRHEPGVIVQSDVAPYVRIVEETVDLIAIDKPSTLPVHPCGGYYRNSLMNLLYENAMATDVNNNNKEEKFYTIHRLDRLTSGLVVIAKNPETAKEWSQAIKSRDRCQKIYLARVKGRFGRNLDLINNNNNNPMLPRLLRCNNPTSPGIPQYGEHSIETKDVSNLTPAQIRRRFNAYGYWMTDAVTGDACDDVTMEQYTQIEHTIDEWLRHVVNMTTTTTKIEEHDGDRVDQCSGPFIWLNMACPVRIEQSKIGICSAGQFEEINDTIYMQTVKPAETRFGIIQYDSWTDSTIVIVQPMTGRTHQIRVHLQQLQHNIANDPNYGGQLWYGNPDGQRACTDAQHILDRWGIGTAALGDNNNDAFDDVVRTTDGLVTADTPATDIEIHNSVQGIDVNRNDTESLSHWIQRTCIWCNRLYGTTNKTEQRGNASNDGINKNDIVEQRTKLEFLVRSPGLWLHAFQYTVNDRSFRTGIPDWCRVCSN